MLQSKLTKIRLAAVLLSLIGCASLPPAPKGNTCIGDVKLGGFDCVPISSALHEGAIRKRDANTFVPFKSVDNWVAFDPSTWANIQTYIGDLKLLAQKQCQ